MCISYVCVGLVMSVYVLVMYGLLLFVLVMQWLCVLCLLVLRVLLCCVWIVIIMHGYACVCYCRDCVFTMSLVALL